MSNTPETCPNAEFLIQYKRQVQVGLVQNIKNIYLYNLRGFCDKKQVKNAAGNQVAFDTNWLEALESLGGIGAEETESFRFCAWNQHKYGVTELLDRKLNSVFEKLADHYILVQKALLLYPNDIEIKEPPEELV